MSDIRPARQALLTRILHGPGLSSSSERQAAFNNSGVADSIRMLVDKTATRAGAITDEDVAASTASGLSEDQVFEILVCAAVGQANRQYESALAALDAAMRKE